MGVSATTDAARRRPSIIEISPKKSPALRVPTVRPFRTNLAVPSKMTNRVSVRPPSWTMLVPAS